MKISAQTIQILKNFASINPSILITPGSKLSTITPTARSVKADAKVEEDFPQECAIYNLYQFLAAISLFENPDFDFRDNCVVISSGNQHVEFRYASKDLIEYPPNKKITLPSVDVQFTMTSSLYQNVMKALGILQLSEIAVQGDESGIYVATVDSVNVSGNSYKVRVAEPNGHTFNLIYRAANLKFMPQDYQVQISSRGFSLFDGGDLQYWVALEGKSKFD